MSLLLRRRSLCMHFGGTGEVSIINHAGPLPYRIPPAECWPAPLGPLQSPLRLRTDGHLLMTAGAADPSLAADCSSTAR